MTSEKNDPRIIVLGAGPSGLYTAHFLQKQGYKNVLVLEKEGHVGGLCRTITSGGRSFDLGANYLTPAYKLTMKLANEVGAKVYSERPFVAMSVPDDPAEPVKYTPIYQALRVDLKTGKPVPWLKFIGATMKYVWLRWKVGRVVDKPSFDGIEKFDNGSLCVPFEEWLENNNLSCLATSFELPITQMGFGYLSQTPAVYALKFMTLASYVPMVLKEAPFIGPLLGWPKRFKLGYQRMWQRVAWNLDVRLNVDVKKITRDDNGIRLEVEVNEENLSEVGTGKETIKADYLIFACPLQPFTQEGTHSDVIKLSAEEESLFSKIKITSYCMTTLQLDDTQLGKSKKNGGPLASIFPVPGLGEKNRVATYGVAKQWDDNPLVQFYTSTYATDPHVDVKNDVLDDVEKIAGQMGGTPKRELGWQTFDRWTYFQHVDSEVMLGGKGEDGWYTRLEAMQGKENTFYVGGATNFELIESIGMYTKNLVEQNFPKRR
jgi:hypothetical protein